MNAKQWLRKSIKPYLKVIKDWVVEQITAAKTELRAEIAGAGSVTGAFKGGFNTVAEMPTGTGIKNGDWAVLKTDDGENESGIYVKASSGWLYVVDITTFDEAQVLLASDDDFNAGISAQKAVTVKQLHTVFATTISDEEAQLDWDSLE